MVSDYLRQAIRDAIKDSRSIREDGIKKFSIVAITRRDDFSTFYKVLVKHKEINAGGERWNATAFSICTYSDWTTSQAMFDGYAFIDDDNTLIDHCVSYGEWTHEKNTAWLNKVLKEVA